MISSLWKICFILSPVAISQGLTICQQNIVMKLTTEFENSVQNFQFDYCEGLDDGRGYTSGIIGFTTGTMDANVVIKQYCAVKPKNLLCRYMPRLKQLDGFFLNGNGDPNSVKGLEGYCESWAIESKSPQFQAIQLNSLKSMYYSPSQRLADRVGLKTPIGRGLFYDTAIQHGPEGSGDSLEGMIDRMSVPGPFYALAPSKGGIEMRYIRAFLKFRKYALCNPQEPSYKEYWCQTLYRIESYQKLLDSSPFFTVSANALDNSGNPITISCYPRVI
ncbi:lysozyme-like domain-containing protein [Globomyces pollinis-pini]|nr:lysozyme-like domain-containing protein [Globomyces pollinis-pini]